jgi:urease subunit gamma/beta
MRLIPWEEERLQLFAAAELARRRRASGLLLNHPEAVAIICDAMLEAARAGMAYADVEAAGRAAVEPGQVLPGVRELLDEVRLEVLLGDGSRVIALVDPLDRGRPVDPFGPGALVIGDAADVVVNEGRDALDLEVTSTSRRRIRVSSHFPFHRLNQRLVFDREAARGFRLDMPSGGYVGWEPGETKTVRLVRMAGRQGGAPLGGDQGGATAGDGPGARAADR